MTTVTYRDASAPLVNFHAVQFEHDKAVEVPDDWSGLEVVRGHPHFTVNDHAEKPKAKQLALQQTSEPLVISIGEARQRGREAYTSGHHRKAPAHFSGAQRKAFLEGYDRARRKART